LQNKDGASRGIREDALRDFFKASRILERYLALDSQTVATFNNQEMLAWGELWLGQAQIMRLNGSIWIDRALGLCRSQSQSRDDSEVSERGIKKLEGMWLHSLRELDVALYRCLGERRDLYEHSNSKKLSTYKPQGILESDFASSLATLSTAEGFQSSRHLVQSKLNSSVGSLSPGSNNMKGMCFPISKSGNQFAISRKWEDYRELAHRALLAATTMRKLSVIFSAALDRHDNFYNTVQGDTAETNPRFAGITLPREIAYAGVIAPASDQYHQSASDRDTRPHSTR
jgi:hypothetical protein